MDYFRPSYAHFCRHKFSLQQPDIRRPFEGQNRIFFTFIASLFVLLRHRSGFIFILDLFMAYHLFALQVSNHTVSKTIQKILKFFFSIFQNYLTEIHPLLVPYLFPIWHMTITGSDYLNLATVVERYLVSFFN